MTIAVAGRKWSVRDVAAVKASQAPYLLGCERCASVCLTTSGCRCCEAYGSRTSGGSRVRYPEDGKHHVRLIEVTRFRSHPQVEAA